MSDLAKLKNVGKAALADFAVLGVTSTAQLAACEADDLSVTLCLLTGHRHAPTIHDVVAASINEARTGKGLDWCVLTRALIDRLNAGDLSRIL